MGRVLPVECAGELLSEFHDDAAALVALSREAQNSEAQVISRLKHIDRNGQPGPIVGAVNIGADWSQFSFGSTNNVPGTGVGTSVGAGMVASAAGAQAASIAANSRQDRE